MPDQQWNNLKEIFHAAVALAPAERHTYLDHACDGNASLRQAVESLLKSHEETGNFVDAPAYQAGAEMLTDGEFKSGQTVAHYKIVSLIDEGGMGRVYLAEDAKLHRKVSLKFLSTKWIQFCACSWYANPRRCSDPRLPMKTQSLDRKSTRLNSSHSQISYA